MAAFSDFHSTICKIEVNMENSHLKEISPKVTNPRLVERTHQRIYRAAAKLFAKKGYHKTTMREIAQAAEINPAYLYKYVSSKDDILYLFYLQVSDSFYRDQIERLEQDVDADPVDQMKRFVGEMFLVTTNRKLRSRLLTLLTESRHLEKDSLRSVLTLEVRAVRAVEGLIRRGVDQGVFRVSDAGLTANLLMLQFALYPVRHWNLKHAMTAEQYVDLMVETVLDMLNVPPEKR